MLQAILHRPDIELCAAVVTGIVGKAFQTVSIVVVLRWILKSFDHHHIGVTGLLMNGISPILKTIVAFQMPVSFGEAKAENDDDADRQYNSGINGGKRQEPAGPPTGLLKTDRDQHYQWSEGYESPLRLHFVLCAADEKEDQRTDTVYQQAAYKWIFYARSERFIK